MAIGSIPPWLENTGPASFTRAASAGSEAGLGAARVAEAAQEASARTALAAQAEANQVQQFGARLAQQERIAQMETQVRKDIAQKAALRQQQELEIHQARNEALFGLGKAKLQQAADIAHAKASDAAAAFADEQGFAKAVAGGMPIAEALYNFPRVRPAIVSSLRQATEKEAADVIPKEVMVGGVPLLVNPKTGHFIKKQDEDRITIRQDTDTGQVTRRVPIAEAQRILGTNAPSIIAPPMSSPVPSTGTTMPAPRTKVQRARELSAQHPDWDKQKVIEEVEAEFER